ncbi:MAG: Tad domain-containing protein [Terracidiphilus sp.]
MKSFWNSFLPRFVSRFAKDQNGQVLPWMALLMVVFLGMAGLTIDLGRAYVCYRELQASSDAAALAGAYAMTQSGATVSTSTSAACSYSSNTDTSAKNPANCSVVGTNSTPNLPIVTTTPKLKCVSPGPIVAVTCGTVPAGNNVIQVTQTATIPTYFIVALSAFGINSAKTLTLNATSTAAVNSGPSPAVNIAVVLDTTASMNSQDTDVNCGNTEIHCALAGLQNLLTILSPCTSGSSKGNCLGGYDQVSLFTFPNIQAQDYTDDTTCTSKNPAIPAYSYVPIPSTTNTSWTQVTTGTTSTYQVTGYEDDYSAGDVAKSGLDTTSPLGIAAGADTGCKGLQAPGGDGTYIAAAMYAAITSLQAQQAANPNSTSALILLSDGGANSSKFDSTFTTTAKNPPTSPDTAQVVAYPSTVNQCQQTVDAGKYATFLGITVYTIAYGASSDPSQCTTDTSVVKGKNVANVISPCTEMANTASSLSTFYSDATASEDPNGCIAPDTSGVGLNGIFGDIGATFLKARLVPNSVVTGG